MLTTTQVYALEKKYHAMHNPLYQQRAAITDVRIFQSICDYTATAISGKILNSLVTQVYKSSSYIILNVRVSMNLLMRRPSSPWLTQIAKTRTGSL